MNTGSLWNKLADLHCLLYNDQIDILFVMESWLHSEIPDELLDPNSKLSYCEIPCDTDGTVELTAIDVALFFMRPYRF